MLSSTAVEPPLFQEASRCDVCKCSFNTFRRRHHCRCCGRTLCHEHSANQMALPQYGIYTNVRVCSDCFNDSSRVVKNETSSTPNLLAVATDDISRLDISVDIDSKSGTTIESPLQSTQECKCGMPLCICEAALPDPAPEVKKVDIPAVQSNPRPRKATTSQRTSESVSKNVAASNSKPSVFFNRGLATSGVMEQAHSEYEVDGEGLREAIKNSDAMSVKKLLNEGVDPNYCDKQGLSLLHLAALFNQTEITFILMDHGANVECKNAQGETPLDCAPTMLQYKMRQKMEEMP